MKIKQVTISHPFSSFQLLIESNYCRISKKFATFSLASHTCMHTHTLFIEKKIHNDWERYGVIISSVFTNKVPINITTPESWSKSTYNMIIIFVCADILLCVGEMGNVISRNWLIDCLV